LWTGGDVDASGDEYDEDNGFGLVGEWHCMTKQASSVFQARFRHSVNTTNEGTWL
jgi:hypothetical protein